MKVLRIDHVQLAMPAGREDEARHFYRDLLGIPERQKPAALAARKAHPALIVADLPALITRFKAAGIAVRDDEPLAGYLRVYVDDPFGNRLELLEPTLT